MIALYHHQYPPSKWMEILPPIKDDEIREVAQLVCLVDKVEAAITRSNADPYLAVLDWKRNYPYDSGMLEAFESLTKFWMQKTNMNGCRMGEYL